jgi:MFS family permease
MLGAMTFGLSLLALSVVRNVYLAALLLACVGGGFIVQAASTNTIIQTIVDERFRGRVMAFYTMAFFGTVPIGSLFAGLLASRIGAPRTVTIGAVVCIISGVWFAYVLPSLRPLIRKIYIERGILAAPDADPGVTTP